MTPNTPPILWLVWSTGFYDVLPQPRTFGPLGLWVIETNETQRKAVEDGHAASIAVEEQGIACGVPRIIVVADDLGWFTRADVGKTITREIDGVRLCVMRMERAGPLLVIPFVQTLPAHDQGARHYFLGSGG